MNMVLCGEACRWQKDGQCTLNDLSKPVSGKTVAGCRYFEEAAKEPAPESET